MTPSTLARRYPLQTGVTVLTVGAVAATLAFWAGLLPVTKSLSTFARLVSLSLFLVAVTIAAWTGSLIAYLWR